MLVGYARVSTADQKASLQIDALRQAGCEEIFEETMSGARKDRPALTEALRFMRAGDTMVVWRLDRLARSLRQLIDTVDELEGRKIGFRSVTEAIDTTTSGGRLVFQIFGALAEFERAIIRERTSAGLVAARARGRVGGRPPALDDRGLQELKALLREPGITVKQAAARMKVSPATVYRLVPGGRSSMAVDDD